jgi:hypothetical protein
MWTGDRERKRSSENFQSPAAAKIEKSESEKLLLKEPLPHRRDSDIFANRRETAPPVPSARGSDGWLLILSEQVLRSRKKRSSNRTPETRQSP